MIETAGTSEAHDSDSDANQTEVSIATFAPHPLSVCRLFNRSFINALRMQIVFIYSLHPMIIQRHTRFYTLLNQETSLISSPLARALFCDLACIPLSRHRMRSLLHPLLHADARGARACLILLPDAAERVSRIAVSVCSDRLRAMLSLTGALGKDAQIR
jgi:hypothetical protein